MAIVKDYFVGQCHIMIDDSAYRDCTPEEIERRKKNIQDTFNRVVRQHYEKMAKEDTA